MSEGRDSKGIANGYVCSSRDCKVEHHISLGTKENFEIFPMFNIPRLETENPLALTFFFFLVFLYSNIKTVHSPSSVVSLTSQPYKSCIIIIIIIIL